jgi:hypothetical protein
MLIAHEGSIPPSGFSKKLNGKIDAHRININRFL